MRHISESLLPKLLIHIMSPEFLFLIYVGVTVCDHKKEYTKNTFDSCVFKRQLAYDNK